MIRALLTLCVSIVACAHAFAQDARPLSSTGTDLRPQAQQIIDAAAAGAVFEAVPDTRLRAIRHRASGFMCSFMPVSIEARVRLAQNPRAEGGISALCVERQGNGVLEFLIARFVNGPFDEIFASATANARERLGPGAHELADTAPLARSPAPPNVLLPYERRHVLLVGDTDGTPTMERISIARLPGDWFIRARFTVFFQLDDQGVIDRSAQAASAMAENIFAARLGELIAPANDPALAGR